MAGANQTLLLNTVGKTCTISAVGLNTHTSKRTNLTATYSYIMHLTQRYYYSGVSRLGEQKSSKRKESRGYPDLLVHWGRKGGGMTP